MFRLMEKARKNNKGFSLVELIVVVLIIAIIAVALAPQVVKYVGQSRTNVDKNNAATIKSAVQVAVADYQAQGFELKAKGSATVFELTPNVNDKAGTGTIKIPANNGTAVGDGAKMRELIEETTGKDIPKIMENDKSKWKVTIDKNGAVTVEAI